MLKKGNQTHPIPLSTLRRDVPRFTIILCKLLKIKSGTYKQCATLYKRFPFSIMIVLYVYFTKLSITFLWK